MQFCVCVSYQLCVRVCILRAHKPANMCLYLEISEPTATICVGDLELCLCVYTDVLGWCWVTRSVGPKQLRAVGGSGALGDGVQEGTERRSATQVSTPPTLQLIGGIRTQDTSSDELH